MNQYKIVIGLGKGRPELVSLKCAQDVITNLDMPLFNACSTPAFRKLLQLHNLIPETKNVKDRITIVAAFETDSIKSLKSVLIQHSNQRQLGENKTFSQQFKQLLS